MVGAPVLWPVGLSIPPMKSNPINTLCTEVPVSILVGNTLRIVTPQCREGHTSLRMKKASRLKPSPTSLLASVLICSLYNNTVIVSTVLS